MEFVTSIESSIVVEAGRSLVAPIGQRVGYLVYYNRNVNNLRMELQKLVEKKITEVVPRVEAARRSSENIFGSVTKWLEEADGMIGTATKFLECEGERNTICLNGLCPNPKSRYSLGKKAMKITENVHTLLQEAGTFTDQIALPGPPPKIGSIFNTEGIKQFKSRLSIENDVWKALKDDNLKMIGICGMGGVGKTTLVKKLIKRVENEKLFDEVAMAVLSQTPELEKIQGEIADGLGLKFGENTLRGKSGKLHERIMKSDKSILLILDDAWKELNFEEIGLPAIGAKSRCKIMLTSRKEDVCNNMGSQKNFPLNVLTKEESWNLFREMVGNSVDRELQQTAMEITKECGGLPIAIITVAKALKNKDRNIWEDALLQLKRSNLESISGLQNNVYSRIELSYNLLGGEESKSCFLLCCLFPEDFNIRVEDLARYGLSLGLFKSVQNMHEARNRVHALVHELKESYMLLDGEDRHYESIKMHDLVRDVAISIASKKEHGYLVSCDADIKTWPEETERYRYCLAISLVRREIMEHPVDLECQKLQLLRLEYGSSSQSPPNNFFNKMNELKVLYLEIMSLPQPIDVLKKLRTLHLQNLRNGELSAIGALISLEILQIVTRSFRELPTEMGELKNLKLLDLREMLELEYIPSGMLSRLSKLEELYVTKGFKSWGHTKKGKINASLSEIGSHPLIALEIGVSNPSVLPEKSVFINLARFNIHIGSLYHFEVINKDLVNELQLEGDGSQIRESGICALWRKTEALSLEAVSNLKNVVYELGAEGFPCLKKLTTNKCDQLEYLVDETNRIPIS